MMKGKPTRGRDGFDVGHRREDRRGLQGFRLEQPVRKWRTLGVCCGVLEEFSSGYAKFEIASRNPVGKQGSLKVQKQGPSCSFLVVSQLS